MVINFLSVTGMIYKNSGLLYNVKEKPR